MSIFAKAKKAKENKKGFTLVELIVVIVILAILAAILVPALLGWIDKAKEKQITLNAASVYKAAQARASELYAAQDGDDTSAAKIKDAAAFGTDFFTTADVDDVKDVTLYFAGTTGHDAYTIANMTYHEGDIWAYLDNSTWTTSKTEPTGSTDGYSIKITKADS